MKVRLALVSALALLLLSESRPARPQASSEECSEAMERAESAAADLALYARRLQRCAEANDFSDDCSLEFRRVRNAHDEYESAVSEVASYCE